MPFRRPCQPGTAVPRVVASSLVDNLSSPGIPVSVCGQIVLQWLVATVAGPPAHFPVLTRQIPFRAPAAMARAPRSDEGPRCPGRIPGWPATASAKDYANGALVTDRRPCTLGRK